MAFTTIYSSLPGKDNTASQEQQANFWVTGLTEDAPLNSTQA